MHGHDDGRKDPGPGDEQARGQGGRRGRAARWTWPCRTRTRPWSSTSSGRSTRTRAARRRSGTPRAIAIIFDHRVPAESSKTATNQKRIREFVGRTGHHEVPRYPRRRGRHLPPDPPRERLRPSRDRSWSAPTATRRATAPSGRSPSASARPRWPRSGPWATALNVEVPKTIKVVAKGAFPGDTSRPRTSSFISSGRITAEGANFKVLEFHGPAIAEDVRPRAGSTVCNMSVEAGATSGIVPPDEETLRYPQGGGEASREDRGLRPGPGRGLRPGRSTIDVAKLEPQIACPHTVDNVKPVGEVAGLKVDQIVIGSCTNGRLDDLAMAARILKGRKVARSDADARLPGLLPDLQPGPRGGLHGRRSSRPAPWS